MTAFYVIGGITAVWAVIVGIIGITRPDFPRGGAEKVVAGMAVLLVAGTIGAGVVGAALEDHGEHDDATEHPADNGDSPESGGHQEDDPDAGPGGADGG